MFKRGICIILTAFFVVFALAGCQPTPEDEIVGNKGEDYIQSMIDDNADSSPYNKLNYSAPESLEYSLDNQIGDVRTLVRVNADVILAENALPIISVSPCDISYGMVKDFLAIIQNGRLLYDMDTCAIVSFKSDVQRQIDKYEFELSMVAADDDESADFYREQLAKLYAELAQAPATVEEANEMLASGQIASNVQGSSDSFSLPGEGETISNSKIEPFELTDGNYSSKYYKIVLGMGTDHPATLFLNTRYNAELPQTIEYARTDVSPVDVVNDLAIMADFTLSVDDALKISEPIAEALDQDLTLFTVCAVVALADDGSTIPYGYSMVFTRKYNGVLANYVDPSNGYLNSSEEESWYNKNYPQESLKVVVDTSGICSVVYSAPQTVTKVESANAQVKSFDEIQEIFNQHIVLTKNDYDTYILIDKVQLGLMRIAKPNSNEFLIIPVWDFYGNSIGATGSESHTDDEYWGMMANYPDRSFLTINAIDGSIIDRSTGY
ncbi:MAG TPA: DUF6034 family protein [Clostridia bacterium]|nr:DUF6034 family protein [Clostridia bacterium]